MNDPSGVIAQVCHEANRAYCFTLGDRNIPGWMGLPDAGRTALKGRVTAELTRLRSGITLAASGEGGAGSGGTGGPPGGESYGDAIKDHIFNGIVQAFVEAEPELAAA